MLQEAYPVWPETKPLIRPAVEADIPALLDLAQEGIDQCGVEETPVDREWLATKWREVLARPDKVWHAVVEVNGELVGYSHGFLGGQWHVPQPMAYLSTMYVKPAHRNIKVFDWLIDGFTKWAETVNAEAVWSCLTNSMCGPAVERLWRRKGFHPAGQMYERYV